MSRFKFRIWDKTKNEWLGASDKNSVTFRNFDLCGQTLRMQQLPMDVEDKDKYVIEQFTGITDKNGDDIYFGDVIAIFTDVIPQHGIVEVGWNCEPYVMLSPYEPYWERLPLLNFTTTAAVIGNIHENPELLEKK